MVVFCLATSNPSCPGSECAYPGWNACTRKTPLEGLGTRLEPAKTSVGDPDPHPYPDPYVFEPPGSASGSGSGSFHHQAKRIRMCLGIPDRHPDPLFRVRIRGSGSASGSVLKCHGCPTLAKTNIHSTKPLCQNVYQKRQARMHRVERRILCTYEQFIQQFSLKKC